MNKRIATAGMDTAQLRVCSWVSLLAEYESLPQLLQQFPPEKGFNITVTNEVHGSFLVNLPRLLEAIKRNDIDNYLHKMEKREILAISIADVIFQKFDKESL